MVDNGPKFEIFYSPWFQLSRMKVSTQMAGDIDAVKSNIINFFTAAGKDRSDPILASELTAVHSAAQAHMSSMAADGRWSDVDYGDIPDSSWSLIKHYDRLWIMAQAYQTHGQPLYGNATLRGKIEKGLEYILNHVYSGCDTPPNWWWWQIGIPYYTLGRILILMQGSMNATIFQAHLDAIAYLIPDNYASYATGANKVWLAFGTFFHSILSGDLTAAQIARNNVGSTCAVFPLGVEGVQADFSFHQHGEQLYTGGYGTAWGDDVANFALFTSGTSGLQLSSTQLATVLDFVHEGIRWGLFHNYFDPSIIGREIVRNGTGMAGLYAMLALTPIPSNRQAGLIAASKKMLETWTGSLGIAIAGLASDVKKSATVAAGPVGHKHFNMSDYTVHRRSTFYASVKMLSSRIIPAELVIGEGLRSWYLSDGLTYVVLRGSEYMSGNVLPTLDWARMPGTTIEQKPRANGEGYHPPQKGLRSFVGGVSVGDHGVSAMDFDANTSALTAKKSWFFFDEEIVCLGSDITCPSVYRTETIVNQWPLSTAGATLTVNGTQKPTPLGWSETMTEVNWAHCDNMGYYFPAGQSVEGRREIRSGRWSDIGPGPTAVHSHPILTLYLDHGANAASASYSYALLPGKTASQVQAYAASNPFTILVQNRAMHAVKHNALDAVGVVFWQAGAVDYLEADMPGVAFYRKSGSVLTMAVSDPTCAASTIHIKYKGKLSPSSLGSGVSSAQQGEDTIITFSVQDGKTYVGEFAIQSGSGRQKPWDGAGITACWYTASYDIYTIISKDRYFALRGDGVWTSSGRFTNLPSTSIWKQAPVVDGLYPWEGTHGITSGWMNPDGILFLVSKDRHWSFSYSEKAWKASGRFADLDPTSSWKQAPKVSNLYPWEGPYGITAGWTNPDGVQYIVSKDRYWLRRWSDRAWVGSGLFANLAADHWWKKLPKVDGLAPWEGLDGITAGWFDAASQLLEIVSKDRFWIVRWSDRTCVSYGKFAALPGDDLWKQSPFA